VGQRVASSDFELRLPQDEVIMAKEMSINGISFGSCHNSRMMKIVVVVPHNAVGQFAFVARN
jgi:hypothetical protein